MTATKQDEFDDEFGDASFLEEIDLDAVVNQAKEKENTGKRRAAAPPSLTEEPPRKRHAGEDQSLRVTLNKYFGFSDFRPGQAEVVKALLRGQDAAVFWCTGQGKSICYQLPALHTGQTALVVSPLISLMQDQVHKLNGLSEKKLATFLGTGQTDPKEEARALRGEYLLVFATPEKLATSGFLNRLSKVDICLVAIDESHCVSEWGHDFRPEYRQAGSVLRNHMRFSQIPIVALTATAVPRIQEDISRSLRLRDPLVSKQSFDRPNLKLSVVRKDRSGNAVRAAMEPLVSQLMAASASSSVASLPSTIVYAPTKAQVEELSGFLQQRLEAEGCSSSYVGQYHAGLPLEMRQNAHVGFLTGRIPVIVATVAFGMGIDKPDVRRVIHYGPPKTLEEYYQQVGRAGRDGLTSECILHTSESDFDRYLSDFYIGNLSGSARESIVGSIKALKSYALDTEKCRRRSLLEFFDEEPSFGERCGTCDACQAVTKYGADSLRDMGTVARIVLLAVDGMKPTGMTQLLTVIGGKITDGYRYRSGVNPSRIQVSIKELHDKLPKKVTQDQFRELIASLVQKGYLAEASESRTVNGFNKSWTVYRVSLSGAKVLSNPDLSVMLPVPESIREAERKAEEKRQRTLDQLEANGIKTSVLPKEEVESGDGEVIRAYTTWINYINRLKQNPEDDRIKQAEELMETIQKWRAETAAQFRMAPAAVLAEHALMSIAYTTATIMPGLQVDEETVRSAGARSRNLESLVTDLNAWVNKYKQQSGSHSAGSKMKLPAVITPSGSWKYAVYKPMKKTGLASWESSYLRFMKGESPQAIAVSPANGRPIQVATVVGHILEGLLHGRPVNMERLSKFVSFPDKAQWTQLEAAEKSTGMDVCGDPSCCGAGGESFKLTDFLRPIIGEEIADKPYQERSEADQKLFADWCGHLKSYMSLRRADVVPSFED